MILLDEVDKLGQDYRGDPVAALLEVLDPEQNSAFNDHYLEIDYDLSQVLFITTANTLANVPDALRDRMEVLRLTGYLDHEKVAIARQFLVPKQLQRNGLEPDDVEWEPDVLTAILRQYTREAGVRELERRIARVARKVARQRVEDTAASAPRRRIGRAVTIAACGALPELLGPAPFDPDETTLEDAVGVARGLAYTAVGGEILDIEVSVVRGRGKLQLTGTLGDVMKESRERGPELRPPAGHASSGSTTSSRGEAHATSTFTSPPAPHPRTDRARASPSLPRSSARSPACRCAGTSP